MSSKLKRLSALRRVCASRFGRKPAEPAPRSRHRGFTLIELLLVLLILGLLASLVGPRVMSYVGSSKSKTARLQLEDLAASLDLYRLEVGRYPSTEQGLQALVEKPADAVKWHGPYLRRNKVPKDPWGSAYHYRQPGQNGPFDLYSLGADGKAGGTGEDRDLTIWE